MENLKALDIIQLLESPSIPFPQLHLRQQASVKELRRALELCSKAHTQQVLCDVLGFRHAKTAVPLLVLCLEDSALGVRSSAADALGKIGDPRVGAALMHHFQQETELPVRRTLACALGAVGCKPAIPLLIDCLRDSDTGLRGCAAWSLGILRAVEALPTLQTAFVRETETWPKTRIHEALQQITEN